MKRSKRYLTTCTTALALLAVGSSIVVAQVRNGGKTILDNGQAHGHNPGSGYSPIIEFKEFSSPKGIVSVSVESDQAEEMSVTCNGELVYWDLRDMAAEAKLSFKENLSSKLKQGANVIVVTAVNVKDHIGFKGSVDVDDKVHELKQFGTVAHRRIGIFYQAVIVITKS